MSAIKRFWRYWCKNIEIARGGLDMSALIATVLLAASSGLCKWVNFEDPIKGFIASYKLADGCEMAAIIVFSGWCLLWLPFRRHETQRKAHGAEKQDLTSRLQQAEARIKPVAEPKDISFKEAGPKQKIKDSLGAYLNKLEDRVLTIKKTPLFGYNKSLKNEEDVESIDLLNEIYFFLDLNVGKAEAAFFKNRPGISFTSVTDWGQSAFKAEKWQGMIDNLNHYAGQLKKIIEKQN